MSCTVLLLLFIVFDSLDSLMGKESGAGPGNDSLTPLKVRCVFKLHMKSVEVNNNNSHNHNSIACLLARSLLLSYTKDDDASGI